MAQPRKGGSEFVVVTEAVGGSLFEAAEGMSIVENPIGVTGESNARDAVGVADGVCDVATPCARKSGGSSDLAAAANAGSAARPKLGAARDPGRPEVEDCVTRVYYNMQGQSAADTRVLTECACGGWPSTSSWT